MSGASGSNRFLGRVAVFVVLVSGLCLAQAGQQPMPDAPSAKKPPAELPSAPQPQANTLPNAGAAPAPERPLPPPSDSDQPAAPPPPQVKTVGPGQADREPGSDRDKLFTLSTNVNFVVVPVTVKDDAGHLVEGLAPKDFTVYEDDAEQRVTFFTSDPFPLSAAVVLDLGLPESTFQKVKNTLSALVGAFGQFDEVSIYTYSNTVAKVQDFTAAEKLSSAVRRLKDRHADEGGTVPVTTGPMAQSSPTINGRPIDPGAPITDPNARAMRTTESHVLNDAILEAALDLAHRDRTRRKVLFVISDGREVGSDAKYSEVLKVLLTRQISVYGIGVGSAAIPVYSQAQRISIPGMGTGNILPKYASATGGQVYNEFSQNAIEQAYARVTEEARNQYTLGYTTRATASSAHRSIEVRVHRPGLKVYAREGYYPLPPARQ